MEVNRNGGMTLLGLCSIDCPPNSTDMEIRNFGLTRITMDQIHDIIQDVEDLKYNDAQYQMNNELQNRDAQTKKGIYSDDFSNTAQSDIYHAEWDARVNEIARFVAPDRIPHSTVLSVDQAGSNASFFGSLALLPGNETVLVEQNDWSEERSINPYAVFDPRDPLAQTFSFTQNQVISSIGLQFTARDPSIPVTVQIRGVTTGLPNGVVFAEKVLAPNEISLSGETRIRFDDPFCAEANTSYAVVLRTNSTNYKVRTATLGKMGRKVLAPNEISLSGETRIRFDDPFYGVLLASSIAGTWTPLNGSDLAMKIYGYNFQSEGMIRFQPITGVQFSDINLDEYSAIPQGTGLDWEYSTDGGVTWDAMVPAEEERLPNLATRVQIRVRLSSSLSNDTPAINFRDVNLVGYLNKTTGTYLTRENELTQGVESTKAYVQMQIPSGTTLQWFASNDGGLTWEAMTIQDTRPIDENWTEYTLVRTFTDNTGNKVRYKAEMTGTPLIYPRIHSLGATLS